MNYNTEKIFNYPILSNEELCNLLKDKEKNEKEIIKGTAKLVICIFNKYYYFYKNYKDDLLQEGFIGLIKAIRTFDINYNIKFTTYAYSVINNEIKGKIAECINLVRLPENKNTLLYNLKTQISEFLKEYEYFPTLEELSEFSNIPIQTIKELYPYLNNPLSLEYPINKTDDNDILKDTIMDEKEEIEESFLKKESIHRLFYVLDNLPVKYKYFLYIKYGFYDGIEHSLEDTTKILYKLNITPNKLTRERARQINETILAVLKSEKILKFIDEDRFRKENKECINSRIKKELIKKLNL